MKLFKTITISTALMSVAFCAAESAEQEVFQVRFKGNTLNLSLPHVSVPPSEGKQSLTLVQGTYALMTKDSAHKFLVTYNCRPCIAVVVKARESAEKYPILMAHTDFFTDLSMLMGKIAEMGIPSDQLHFTFFTNTTPYWDTVDSDGDTMRKMHGGKTQEQNLKDVALLYQNKFEGSAVKTILCPYTYTYETVLHRMFINETIAVDKTGKIFSLSPFVSDVLDLESKISPTVRSLHASMPEEMKFATKFQMGQEILAKKYAIVRNTRTLLSGGKLIRPLIELKQ